MAKTDRFNEAIYADFHEGFNNSVSEISIKDSEVCIAENVEFSTEVKAIKKRNGADLWHGEFDENTSIIPPARYVQLSVTEPLITLDKDRYEFRKLGSNWVDDERHVINLENYGVTITSGTPLVGDRIVIEPGKRAQFIYPETEVTDVHTWFVGNQYKTCIVMNDNLYEVLPNGDLVDKECEIHGKMSTFSMNNKFYMGDGVWLYVWGDFDYDSNQGTTSVRTGDIVRNSTSTYGGSEIGNFYRYLGNDSDINLRIHNYNGSDWENVTAVPFFASDVVRQVRQYDPSKPEIVHITVIKGSTAAGTITIYLNDVAYGVSVGENASINTIVNAIKALNVTGWSSRKNGNTVIFTRSENALTTNGFVDPGETGCVLTYTTEQEGKINDNHLSPIRACTMFAVHQGSQRVFATGNPDDNAIYYSEIGQPDYFKSDFNKLYPENKYGRPTGIFQLSDSILVSFENGWYEWNGINVLDDAKWKPIALPYGCVNNRTIALTPYSFTYLGKDGIYTVSSSILNTEVAMVQGSDVIKKITGSRIDKVIADIESKDSCQAIFFNDCYYLAYHLGVFEATHYINGRPVRNWEYNDHVLKFEWETKSFSEITGWRVYAWCNNDEGLHFASRNSLLTVGIGDNDYDVDFPHDINPYKPINFHVKTKEYGFGAPFKDKVVRLIGVVFKQPICENEIDADIRVNMGYQHYGVEYQLNSVEVTESLIYGRNWALRWGYREAIVKMIELTMPSNTYQLDISNSKLNSPITVIAIGFVYEPTDFVTPTLLKDEVLLK